ncbi:hypothetical protein [Marinobacter sp.]|uniref:hypothetical protein n=1 Tax=Marinobacter sp. TaxID=50741 RepID=UPI00384DE5A1
MHVPGEALMLGGFEQHIFQRVIEVARDTGLGFTERRLGAPAPTRSALSSTICSNH